jgi:hypothetical protein
MARRGAPEAMPIMHQRQVELDYVTAARAARSGDLATAARMALRAPLPAIAAKLLHAAAKRVGRRSAADA